MLHQLARMSEVEKNTKTEGTMLNLQFSQICEIAKYDFYIFTRFARCEKMNFHVGPDFQNKKKRTFVSDQVCGMKNT